MESTASSSTCFPTHIADGDTVVISGGGLNRCITIKKTTQMKLGRCGNVIVGSLVGQRYGDVFAFDDKSKKLVPTLETPELDRSEIQADHVVDENKDNRQLFDTHGSNQTLTEEDIHALRSEHGVENIVKNLVENSATFNSKTAFSQEKYVRKKKGKYILKFKVERLCPDNLSETILPTLLVEADEEDDGKRRLPLRVDTLGLILHHGNISGNMRVMCHDRTNGLLPACILNRLGLEGTLYVVYDKTSMPATAFAKNMHVPQWKERWKAIPASPQFFSDEAEAVTSPTDASSPVTEKVRWEGEPKEDAAGNRGPSQWIKAKEARQMFAEAPADTLIIAGFENEIVPVLKKLFPFLSLSGNLVIYCPFMEPLERIYALIRDEAVCISISDTWYRHQQVLPGRTHPQVNMSTAGGFILTAVKVENAIGCESIFGTVKVSADASKQPVIGQKREREEGEQPTRSTTE